MLFQHSDNRRKPCHKPWKRSNGKEPSSMSNLRPWGIFVRAPFRLTFANAARQTALVPVKVTRGTDPNTYGIPRRGDKAGRRTYGWAPSWKRSEKSGRRIGCFLVCAGH